MQHLHLKKSATLFVTLAIMPLIGRAQSTSTWNTTTGNWSVSTNWSPTGAPVSNAGNALTFGGAASYTATNNISSDFQLNSLSLTNTAGRVTIAGSSLNFISSGATTPTITHTTTGTEATTISANVVLTNDLGITATGSSSFDWLTITGAVSGAGKLSISTGGGNYFVILANTNSYSGGTSVTGGLKTSAAGALGSGAITLGGNGKWIINTTAQSYSNAITLNGAFAIDANVATTLGGNIALGSSQLTLRGSAGSATSTASGVISGAGNILKGDAGSTWILSGNNTYTGTTGVNAGTLLINGNQAASTGAVSVAASATLGGDGTIGGAVTVANSGILSPGAASGATGTLSLNNKNLTLSGADTKIQMEIAGTSAGAFDRIAGVSTLSLNGDLTLTLTGTYTTANWDVLDFSAKSGNFDTVTLAGSYAGSLSRIGDTWTGNVGGQDWTFEQTTGVLSVVPEPGTVALVIAGLGFTLLLRRRQRA